MIPIGKNFLYWTSLLKNWFRAILFFLPFLGCAPSSLEELRCEGEAQTKKLARELQEIDTKDELIKALPRLKKRYNRLADLLLEARNFQENGNSDPSPASEELFAELARLYEIPGCRESIETAQIEAIRKLDRPQRKRN